MTTYRRNKWAMWLTMLAAFVLVGVLWHAIVQHRAYRSQEHRLQVLQDMVDMSPAAFVIVDDMRNIIMWGDGATALFGYTCEEMQGETIERLLRPVDYVKHKRGLVRRIENPNKNYPLLAIQCVGINKSGEQLQLLVVVASFDNTHGRCHVALISRITETQVLVNGSKIAGDKWRLSL